MPLVGSYDWTKDNANVDPTTGKPRKRKKPPGSQAGTTVAGTPQAGATYTPTASAAAPSFAPSGKGSVAPGGATGGGLFQQSQLGGALGTLEPDYQMLLGSAQGGQPLWGSQLPGGTASNAAGFYAQNFDPYTLGIASGLGQSGTWTNQDVMGFGEELARELTGGAGGGKFLDPMMMVKNILSTAAGMTEKAVLGGETGPLAGLADQNPYTQVSTLVDLLRGALSSTLSNEVLEGFLSMVNRVGMQWADSQGQVPIEQRQDSNVATALLKQLGPTLGMANAGPGGMATTSAQRAAAF